MKKRKSHLPVLIAYVFHKRDANHMKQNTGTQVYTISLFKLLRTWEIKTTGVQVHSEN